MIRFKKFGKYSIIKTVASGGMADILLSVSLSPTGFGRFVIIKKTLSKFSKKKEFIDMFKNEAKVACNLKHKNITSIYEFGVEKDQFFLTMEYISGKNLRELTKKIISRKKEIGIENAIYIIKEVASGLNYAHNAIDFNTGLPLHIIHRDISPQNIMISFEGEIKLIDFGIAKVSDTDLTKAGHLKGKFSYMSPEQAQGEVLDERTDIFCLGIVLWELLTGKRLFSSENEMASLRKVRNCDIPSAQKINSKIPTALNNIVMKALNKNKNLRYKTASQFEKDLSLFLNQNYPDYSHYNLVFLIKTMYREEILKEREDFKIYSLEFKKYVNSLNLDKKLSVSQFSFRSYQHGDSQSLNAEQQSMESLLETATNNNAEISKSQNEENSDFIEEDDTEISDSLLSINESLSNHSTQSAATFKIPDSENTVEEKSFTKSKKEMSSKGKTFEGSKKEISSKRKTFEGSKKELSSKKKTFEGSKKELTSKENFLNNLKLPPAKKEGLLLKVSNDNLASHLNTLSSTDKGAVKFKVNRQKRSYTKSSHSMFDMTDVADQSPKKIETNKKILFALIVIGISSIVYFLLKSGVTTFNVTSKAPPIETAPSVETAPPVEKTPLLSLEENSPNQAVDKNVFISSTPSNAKIYVNDKFISKYTPSIITVRSDEKYIITLKKRGYNERDILINSGNNTKQFQVRLFSSDSKRKPIVHVVE
ncbi:MAG: serine/threonine protein kinase [Bdellovibrionales bacterium]|nr:serine/threonine protein kinase [Bdellovibrionales bacterium]